MAGRNTDALFTSAFIPKHKSIGAYSEKNLNIDKKFKLWSYYKTETSALILNQTDQSRLLQVPFVYTCTTSPLKSFMLFDSFIDPYVIINT